MKKIQYQSIPDPVGRPDLARKAAITAVRAAAMGLVPRGEEMERLDLESLRRVLTHIGRAGIGSAAVKEAAVAYEPERLAALLEEVQQALARSPVPDREWPEMERVFDAPSLARLLGISSSSLRRYASGSRQTPDPVAARLHCLALVVGDLGGSYNEVGIRRWFERPRSQLGGRSPADLLSGEWDPDDEGPTSVQALAAALLSSPAT
jgi:uncharacterized protein (DUF2384 family)